MAGYTTKNVQSEKYVNIIAINSTLAALTYIYVNDIQILFAVK